MAGRKPIKVHRRKSVHTKNEAVVNDVQMVEDNANLTEKQRLFCLYFAKCFNATRAYLKAYNCSYSTAAVEGCRLLKNPKIKEMIDILKKERITREYLTQEDIFQKYMDIAFSDIGDYVTFGKKRVPMWVKKDGRDIPVIDPNTGKQKINEYSYVDLKESDYADTSILAEISEGQNGIKIKMYDQLKALDWLAAHMDMATAEQKAKIDLLNAQRDKLQHKEDDGEDESVVMSEIRISDLIIPKYQPLFNNRSIKHIILTSGRAGTKSSFAAIRGDYQIVSSEKGSVVVLRKHHNKLRKTVYKEMLRGISRLKVPKSKFHNQESHGD